MLKPKKRIIIVGLFQDKDRAPVTQASELADILRDSGYNVLKVSKHLNKWHRTLDITTTLVFKRYSYDIAIVQFYSGNSFIWQYIAAKIVKALNKKLIFTIHGGGVPDKLKTKTKKYASLLKEADAITVPSGYIADAMKPFGIQSELIENSLYLNKYPFYTKEKVKPSLLWMRAFGDIYNPFMAVEVVYELKKKYPNVKLYMGGPDLGMLEETKKRITQQGLDDNVEIVGFMNLQTKIQYASKASIYLSTNKIDNAPVTFLEMWAMGIPVISTNVGGIPYLIEDGKNGLLVDANDHKAMAQKISMLLEDKGLYNSIANAGREKVKMYDEHAVYEKWDKLLSGL